MPEDMSSDTDLMANVHRLTPLHQACSLHDLAAELECWTQIEEMNDFVEMVNQEKEESISQGTFIQALHTKIDVFSSNEEMEDVLPVRIISDLDVTDICGSLIDLQQLLAKSLEKARHEMMHASRMAQHKPAAITSSQTLIDAFLKPAAV